MPKILGSDSHSHALVPLGFLPWAEVSTSTPFLNMLAPRSWASYVRSLVSYPASASWYSSTCYRATRCRPVDLPMMTEVFHLCTDTVPVELLWPQALAVNGIKEIDSELYGILISLNSHLCVMVITLNSTTILRCDYGFTFQITFFSPWS